MPATDWVLYMRSWMIGWLLGTLLMAFAPVLLPGASWPVALATALFAAWRTRPVLCGALVACVFCSWRGELQLEDRWSDTCNSRPVTLLGRIANLPMVTSMGEGRRRQRFELLVEQVSETSCGSPRRVLLSYYGDELLQPGERWSFSSKLRRPWGLSNPGSFNMQAWYALSGIDALGSVASGPAHRVVDGPVGIEAGHHRARQRISRAIAAAQLSDHTSAVLSALAVADKSGLDYAKWSLFQHYGINHLLVISGLHVAMLAGLAFAIGGGIAALFAALGWGCSRWPWRELSALLVAVAYTALAGFSVATVRALVMLIGILGARVLQRETNGFNGLFLAAVLLVAINPMVIVGAGFWLSFGAVISLLWLARWRGGGRLGQVLAAQLFMGLAMLPIGAWWFGGSSWIAPLANLLMIPLVGMYVIPLTLAGAFLALLDAGQLAVRCWHLAALPLDALWPLAEALRAKAPLMLPVNADLFTALLALLGVVVVVLPISLHWRLASLAMLLPLLAGSPPGLKAARLDVLDVGQGTAVVVQAAGRVLLYDTGGGNPAGPNLALTVVLPWLRYQGVLQLQDLVISHSDLDHSAGQGDVLAAYPRSRLWQGEVLSPRALPCRAGVSWRWPDGSLFRFLGPAGGEAGNDASCVLQIAVGDRRILLPGDIGEEQEKQLVRYWGNSLRSDILLVGHHGSNSSTYQAWLNQVKPQLALVGAGYASRFGHPHPAVIERLHRSGITVLETAREGALSLRLGPGGSLSLAANRWGYQTWWM